MLLLYTGLWKNFPIRSFVFFFFSSLLNGKKSLMPLCSSLKWGSQPSLSFNFLLHSSSKNNVKVWVIELGNKNSIGNKRKHQYLLLLPNRHLGYLCRYKARGSEQVYWLAAAL